MREILQVRAVLQCGSMLFPPQSVRDACARILRQAGTGELDMLTASARLLEIHPGYGPAYLMRGVTLTEAGHLDEAEHWLWKGVECEPCQARLYMPLADVRRRRDDADPLSQQLRVLAVRKLGAGDTVPSPLPALFEEHFKKLMKMKLEVDFTSPITYHLLAEILQKEQADNIVPPDALERLLPYRLLTELQEQAPVKVSPTLIGQIRENAGVCLPVLRSALREWAWNPHEVNVKTIALVAALLGEIGGPDGFEDLCDFAGSPPPCFLHGNWAIFRLGQRYPAEVVKLLRASAANTHEVVRAWTADHLDLMPELDETREALLGLLDGFEAFAKRDTAAFLLLRVTQALNRIGAEEEAEAAMARFGPMLSEPGRRFIDDARSDGSDAVFKDAGFDELDILDVCVKRSLFQNEAADPVEVEWHSIKPGRNDPCWCGSGKKYKKCHRTEDEESSRAVR